MKRITLEALIRSHRDTPYNQQYEYILTLISEGRIKPLVSILRYTGNIG